MSIVQAMRGVCKFAQVMSRTQRLNAKISKDKLKKKKFLEEDYKWAQVNDEEVISLMSCNSDGDEQPNIVPLQNTKGRFYPLIFLMIFLSTNISPVIMNCYGKNMSLQCMATSSRNLNPAFDMLYQVGNLACTLLSVLIFNNIHGLQKASGSPVIANGCSANFVLGSLGAVFWMVYAVLTTIPEQGYDINIADEITLILYFSISLGYNLFNQVKLKARIEDAREGPVFKKLVLFNFKNVLCFVIMAVVLSYIALLIGHTVLVFRSPLSIAMPVISEYIELAKIMGILLSQFCVALYYIDINYIYQGAFSSARSFEKKLDMSRL